MVSHMTTATLHTDHMFGGVYLPAAGVIQALHQRGLHIVKNQDAVLVEAMKPIRMTLSLTGFAQGVMVDILFDDAEQLVSLRDAITTIIDAHQLEIKS